MNHPAATIVLSLLKKTIKWRRQNQDEKLKWSDMHLETVHDYLISLYPSCHFTDLRFARRLFNALFIYNNRRTHLFFHAGIADSFTQELHQFFRVPTLKKFLEEEGRIKKHQLVQVFLSFLVGLLNYKAETFDPCQNQIGNLDKELKFLVTVLGDKSLLTHEHEEEFQNLAVDFEAVANEAGSLIYSLLFSATHQSFRETNECLTVVLNRINLLKADILRFLDLLLPCISEPAYKTAETFMLDSLILHSVIRDLEDLISREDNLIAHVKVQIELLHQGLTFLQSSIKGVGGRPSEIGELKELLKRSGNMAHQAEYLIVSFLSGDAPLWYLINRLTYINKKIELAGNELQEITRKHKLGDVKAARYFNKQGGGDIEVDDVLVGFKEREPEVLNYLVGRGQGLRAISIAGMPGLGKTSFAKKLFNHPSVNTWFDKRSWCVVSQTYHSQNILADLLIQINGEFSIDSTLKMDSKSLIVQIHQTLCSRRYLIVMDDVWDSNLWDDLVGCFPDDGNGSRILFTTRNKDVCPSNCDNYALSSLSNEECWELLEKKVFGNNTCPPQLVGIGKEIAVNCWGLPLAVVVVAGILSSMEKEKNIWKEVGGNLASNIFGGGDNSVMQILELSYKHLPEHLKPCFLYFGAFPKGKDITVRKLMRLWIAEGFIHMDDGERAEDVAEEYLMELISKSLVMVAERGSHGGVKTCILHDLLHDLCFKICENENFLKFDKGSTYSVYENGLLRREPSEYCMSWSYCQQIRSLHDACQTSAFFPGRTRLLRVFHFDYVFRHLTGIEYLVNLRYLVIGDIPESISKLVNLEYLRVAKIEDVYLPPALLSMMKLRYLSAPNPLYDSDCDTSQTSNLEFLSCIIIKKLKDEDMLKCSPNLRKLKCRYLYPDMGNIDLSFLSHIESLKLTLVGFQDMGNTISFPVNIKKLTLSGWLKLPWEKMSIFGRLEKLEVLKLGTGVFVGERWDMQEGEFQKLKFLKLDQVFNLREWNAEHFPMLQRLVLKDCKRLQEIPVEIGEVASLQLIEIKGECAESVVESAKLIQQQQFDIGNEELRVLINAY